MAKALILKPIVWNEKNYKAPSGSLPNYKRFRARKEDSYPTYHGFGYEEWNNADNRLWRGYKLFHTEKTDRLLEYSSNGNLGIMMIASHKGNQFAVGIACNVYDNNEEEISFMSRDINFYDNWNKLWKLDSVRYCFKENQERFLEEWQRDYKWVAWKCPAEYFYWFKKPMRLDAKKLTGKKRLTTMYGRWQGIRRQDVLAIITNNIPKNHKIRDWLVNGEFDNSILSEEMRKKPQKPSSYLQKRYGGSGSNRPTERAYQYWVEGIITAEPLHAPLQEKFVDFLKKEKLSIIVENQNYIDVQYNRKNNIVYAEIKPTKNIESKYAIRIAVGQLLEYKYNNNNSAKLEIVISNKPKENEIKFVKHLGIILTYYDEKSNKFNRCE